MLTVLSALMRAINGLNKIIGLICAWAAIGIVLVCFAVVFERYVFGITRLWAQDLYVWLNGAMFTGVAAFALYRGDHVRVDIFYRPASPKRKAIADLVGVCVFLLPFTYVVYTYCLGFVQRSWGLKEASANIGGMPGLFILKSFIIGFAILVALQGISMAVRSILVLGNREDLIPQDYRYSTDTQAGKE